MHLRMRVVRSSVVAFAVCVAAGCYEMHPADYTAATPGTEMAFDITDAGRVALGGSMGPEISNVEGRIVDSDTASYLVAVTAVHFFRGGQQAWTGEKVRLQRTYVSHFYERRFSRSRTVVMSALGIGATALIASQAILGNGSINNDRPPDTSAHTLRIPRP